ncbi:unnamed protein product [Nyctereutes procyonoides]|uniref:(raccoon dog) hypothetical protein n=1 Tax=Nyctereutes procyonoides TaxID=34880 RepID=A0A811Z8X4_NYCPR|nr:unnamed protein product [Nyctereutes procyonoides]
MAQFVHNFVEKAPVLLSMTRLSWFFQLISVEIPTTIQSLKKMVKSEALLNGLVATEVWMWFYVIEIIGKCDIAGYGV